MLDWHCMNPTSSEGDQAYILADSGVVTRVVDPASFSDRPDRARVLAARVPGVQRLLCFGANDGVGQDLRPTGTGRGRFWCPPWLMCCWTTRPAPAPI